MTNYWVVRAGEDIRDSVEEGHFVGIGFGGDQIGDLSGLPYDQIRDRFAENNPGSSPNEVGTAAGQLDRFTNKIAEHHWVLTPIRNRNVLIGEVTSDYTYDPSHLTKPHRRFVRWQKKVPRNDFTLPYEIHLAD